MLCISKNLKINEEKENVIRTKTAILKKRYFAMKMVLLIM